MLLVTRSTVAGCSCSALPGSCPPRSSPCCSSTSPRSATGGCTRCCAARSPSLGLGLAAGDGDHVGDGVRPAQPFVAQRAGLGGRDRRSCASARSSRALRAPASTPWTWKRATSCGPPVGSRTAPVLVDGDLVVDRRRGTGRSSVWTRRRGEERWRRSDRRRRRRRAWRRATAAEPTSAPGSEDAVTATEDVGIDERSGDRDGQGLVAAASRARGARRRPVGDSVYAYVATPGAAGGTGRERSSRSMATTATSGGAAVAPGGRWPSGDGRRRHRGQRRRRGRRRRRADRGPRRRRRAAALDRERGDTRQEPRLRPPGGGPAGRWSPTPSCSCRPRLTADGRRSTRPGEAGFPYRRAGYDRRIGWSAWSSRRPSAAHDRHMSHAHDHASDDDHGASASGTRWSRWVRGRLAPTGEDLEERASWRVKTRWILGAWAVLSAVSALGTALTPALLAFPMVLVAFTPRLPFLFLAATVGQPGAVLRRRRPPDARRRSDPHRPRPPLRRALRPPAGAAADATASGCSAWRCGRRARCSPPPGPASCARPGCSPLTSSARSACWPASTSARARCVG